MRNDYDIRPRAKLKKGGKAKKGFPDLNKEWIEVSREDFDSDEKNEYNYSFIEYDRYEF